MSSNDIIVSLDIGTSKIRVIIGEVNNGAIHIIGVGSADSEGIRKGAIVDIDQTVQSIRNAVDHAERMVGIQITHVYVGINGSHIGLQSSQGVVAVSNEDREIGEEDIERVLQASRVVALPPEREIIGVVPKQYIVDGLEGIQDPRGMIGVRLEVDALIITGAKTSIHNLRRVVEKANLTVAGLLLTPLASGYLMLTKDEKESGTVLVDLGAGLTTVSVFAEGTLAATSTLPVGGEHVTNDISIVLNTLPANAEKLKLKFGCASSEVAAADQLFKVPQKGSATELESNQVHLAEIIESRLQEMLQMVRAEAYKLGWANPPGGYVLTGGTASIPGLQALAERELQASVRIAFPDFVGVRDPAYAGGVGIIQYVNKNLRNRSKVYADQMVGKKQADGRPGWFERFKNWISEFI